MGINLIVFSLVSTAAFIAGIIAWRGRHIPGLNAFLLTSSGIIIWALGRVFTELNFNPSQNQLWLRASILGLDLLPVSWLAFVLLYARGKQKLSWPIWLGLLTLPVISQVTEISLHGMTVSQPAIWFESESTITWLAIRHSVWGWAHLIVGSMILLTGGVLLILHLAHTPGIMRRNTRWIDILSLVPMVVYLIEFAGVKVITWVVITPFAFLVGEYAFLWSIRRGAHFQVLPEARDLLLEWMDNGILVLDRDGNIIDVNQAAANLINKPSSELLGLKLIKLFPQMSNLLDRSPSQDTIRREILVPSQGNGQWIDFRITPLYKNTQDYSGYMLEMTDVTRRRLAEDSLRDSEQRYRQVIDGMIEGVVVQDADGVIIACNPNAELILGKEMADLIGRKSIDPNWRAIREDGSPIPEEEHPSTIALSTGIPQKNVTMRSSLPDGTFRWLLINSQPLIKDNEKKPYAIVTTFVDITENRKTEQTLRDSENMFRSLLESAPVAIIISDEQGIIHLMNARAEQLFDYERTEVQGALIEKLIPERFQNTHISQRNEFVRQSRSRPMGQGRELVARQKDGTEIPVDVGLDLIHTNNGTYVMSYLMDITERKQSEEALQQANEQLVRSLVELENHNRELVSLTEMGDLLQICASVEEAYSVVASFAQKLFPDCSGVLYMSAEDKAIFEMVIAWGEQLPDEYTFTANLCWALRRGQAHVTDFISQTLACQHSAYLPEYGYTNSICVPMGARGEVIGLFHLRWKTNTKQRTVEHLAATVAEHITLSLSNLMLRENLREQSIRDPLTGLFNRRYLEEAFNHELHRAARRSHSIGVIMLDVDHFKTINDCFGHAHGDFLLIELAAFLRNRLRGEDILCRYGGEEFAIILPDTNIESAIHLAEKLRAEIKEIELDLADQPYEPITISLGVAAFPEHGRNADELLKSADRALYQAKQKGRDRVMVAQNLA